MTYVALILGLVAIVMAWNANRQNNDLKERISHLHDRIYTLKRQVQETDEQAKTEMTALRFELLKAQGNLKVTGDMTIKDLSMVHPQALQVLGGFHIGGCSSCAVDENQRLDLAVAQSGRELEPILIALNNLVLESQNGQGHISEEQLKQSNVQLMF